MKTDPFEEDLTVSQSEERVSDRAYLIEGDYKCWHCEGKGVYKDFPGPCYRCDGKGFHDREDRKRNHEYREQQKSKLKLTK